MIIVSNSLWNHEIFVSNFSCGWPGLLSQSVFCRPCKTTTVHLGTTESMGPLIGTNKVAWGVKLLLTTIWSYQVDCGSFCALLRTQLCCLPPCGWYCLPSASHPPPTPTPPLPSALPPTNFIRDIAGLVKNQQT